MIAKRRACIENGFVFDSTIGTHLFADQSRFPPYDRTVNPINFFILDHSCHSVISNRRCLSCQAIFIHTAVEHHYSPRSKPCHLTLMSRTHMHCLECDALGQLLPNQVSHELSVVETNIFFASSLQICGMGDVVTFLDCWSLPIVSCSIAIGTALSHAETDARRSMVESCIKSVCHQSHKHCRDAHTQEQGCGWCAQTQSCEACSHNLHLNRQK